LKDGPSEIYGAMSLEESLIITGRATVTAVVLAETVSVVTGPPVPALF